VDGHAPLQRPPSRRHAHDAQERLPDASRGDHLQAGGGLPTGVGAATGG
jgi:hypothetical protein